MDKDKVYWYSNIGSKWQEVEDVYPSSVIARELSSLGPEEIWDDGYGGRYKWTEI